MEVAAGQPAERLDARLREDVQNQNLLYLGTEFAVWASAEPRRVVDASSTTTCRRWRSTNSPMHPTAGEIVAATHGRSLWVLDVTPLRQMTTDVLKEKAHLYRPNAVVRWHMEQGRGGQFSESERRFIGQNPPRGAQLYYALGDKADKVTLKVLDYAGKTVADFSAASGEPGLHRIAWNLTTGTQRTGAAGEGGRRRGGRGAPQASGPPAAGSRQAGRQPPSAAGQPSAGARPPALSAATSRA